MLTLKQTSLLSYGSYLNVFEKVQTYYAVVRWLFCVKV